MKLTEEILKRLEAKLNVAKKNSKAAEAERDAIKTELDAAWDAQLNCVDDNYDDLALKKAILEGKLNDNENWLAYRNGELVGLKWALDIVRDCVDREKRRAEIEKDEDRIWKEMTA